MADIADIGRMVEDQGKSWTEFQAVQGARMKNLESEVFELAKKAGRPFAGGAELDPAAQIAKHEQFINSKTGKAVPVFAHGDKLASIEKKAAGAPSFGRLVRGMALGGLAADAGDLAEERKSLGISSDPSGGYLVQGALSSEWIDALRSQMVLSKAGCRTVPMDTASLALARVVTDPTVSWHGENAALPTGDPTFGRINLTAKTAVCLCKISLELSQDAANIEQILASTITSAMAGAIDSAGLVGVTTDAGAAPSGVFNLTSRNSVTSIGAPVNWDWVVDGMYELMLDNVPAENIGALIAHPAVWKTMRKLKTGITTDETALTMPAEVGALPKLWTTAAPLVTTTAAGIIANWGDLLMGIRKDIQIRVITESLMASNLQVAILAYARCDFGATRPASFCTLEGITVS